MQRYSLKISVRTAIEITRNRNYYESVLANIVGPFHGTLQRVCNNKQLAELYEVATLANVIQCNIQSVYPYIHYTAYMNIMNDIFRPMQSSNLINNRIFIFLTRAEDQVATKSRDMSGGVCSPHYFLPLVEMNAGLGVLDGYEDFWKNNIEEQSKNYGQNFCLFFKSRDSETLRHLDGSIFIFLR